MQNFRTGLGLVAALIPIGYCGWLVWYFTDMGGLDNPLISAELSPTIIGLAIVGLLLVIGFSFQVRRAFKRPGSGEGGSGPRPAASPRDDDSDRTADADAMIARYLAQRDAPGNEPLAARPAAASFGRRARR